jgi:hypothetical protein
MEYRYKHNLAPAIGAVNAVRQNRHGAEKLVFDN